MKKSSKTNVLKKLKNNKILLFGLVIGFAAMGSVFLTSSRAETSFEPLQVGVNWHAGWMDGLHTDADNFEIVDKMVEAGITQARIDIGWVNIEETGDVLGGAEDPTSNYDNGNNPYNNWYVKRIDTAVNYANSKGIEVLGIWWTSPAWARDGAPDSTSYRVRPDKDAYAESLEWAAKYWKGRIDNWQIWNEPNPAQKFYGAPPDATSYGGTQNYVELVKAAYPRAKVGNPDANIVLGGPSGVYDDWISELYSLGIQGYFDTMSIHPYQGPMSDGPLDGDGSKPWHFLRLPVIRDIMIANGDGDKPIWLTEIGWSDHTNETIPSNESWNFGVTPQQQGDYFVQAIDYAKKNWPYVESIMYYTEKNINSGNSSPSVALHQSNFGLLNLDNSPKTSYNILKTYMDESGSIPPPPPPPPADDYPDINANLVNTSVVSAFSFLHRPVYESSGMAVTQGMYLTHDDSGGANELYAYGIDSRYVGKIVVPGATNVDWEDMAVVPKSGSDDIYVADIGDNGLSRSNLKIYKFNIPSVNKEISGQTITATNLETYNISYNDGKHDAESFAVNPINGRPYILSKSSTAYVYEGPANLSTSTNNVFTKKVAMPVKNATGADFSKDGRYFVVTLSYQGGTASIWEVENDDIVQTITDNPTRTNYERPSELTQIEAVTFTPNGKHIVLSSEGVQSVWSVPNPIYSDPASPPPPSGIQGDVNNDDKVDIVDLSILLSAWNTNDSVSDLDNSGNVDIVDLSILLSNWSA